MSTPITYSITSVGNKGVSSPTIVYGSTTYTASSQSVGLSVTNNLTLRLPSPVSATQPIQLLTVDGFTFNSGSTVLTVPYNTLVAFVNNTSAPFSLSILGGTAAAPVVISNPSSSPISPGYQTMFTVLTTSSSTSPIVLAPSAIIPPGTKPTILSKIETWVKAHEAISIGILIFLIILIIAVLVAIFGKKQ